MAEPKIIPMLIINNVAVLELSERVPYDLCGKS